MTDEYLAIIKRIREERLYASISIKPSSLGYTWNKSACLQNILAIARTTSEKKVGFEIDMEGRSLVDFTLDASKPVRDTDCSVTVALQAYLDRTAQRTWKR